jgi:hypothetical protein
LNDEWLTVGNWGRKKETHRIRSPMGVLTGQVTSVKMAVKPVQPSQGWLVVSSQNGEAAPL